MKTVYYAHAYCTYGYPCETTEIRTIRRHLKRHKLINPSLHDNPRKQIEGMAYCLRLVEQCDVLAFSRIMKKVTCGVGKEVNHALKKGKTVYEITRNGLIRRRRKIGYLAYDATIRLYGVWRRKQWALAQGLD